MHARSNSQLHAAVAEHGENTVMSKQNTDNNANIECVICREELLGELLSEMWTCTTCDKQIHRACLAKYFHVLQSQRCNCALPGLCSCRPAPMCPLCRAPVPASMTRGRQCGTPTCTLKSGHGGLCSSEQPVVTDVHGRARRSLARRIAN
jgi:hypothetical protein